VATLANLSDRLRAEIGDYVRSLVETFTGDGSTKRYQLITAPVLGSSLVIKVAGVDVSSTTQVEEQSGMLILATAPAAGASISIAGTAFKYFTKAEIELYVHTAFMEHARTTTDSNGSKATISTLPAIDEYPLILLASTMALFTLATDAAFDIDIISPDGVSIPRSERFRQLNEIIQSRKEQYRELCNLLDVGMHRIEVSVLRRISRLTNRYIPIYRPQEMDDWSLPQRVRLPIPTYGDITPASAVASRDLSAYSGDDFSISIKFSLDLAPYTPKAELRLFQNSRFAQVGPVIVGTFLITKTQSAGQFTYDTLMLSLTGAETAALPRTAYYDIQLTAADGTVKTYLQGKVYTQPQVTL